MALENDDYRYGLQSRGRPRSINVPDEEEAVTRQRQPRSAERQIDIQPVGMMHLADTPPPYDTLTADILNLEPHRGGFRPRYDDEVHIEETEEVRKPFAMIPVAGHVFYALRYFLKPDETKPLDWVYYAIRGNAVYIMLDDNSILTVRYLGTWLTTEVSGSTSNLIIKADVSDVFFEDQGGYIQIRRNLYKYDSLELLPNGQIKLYNFQPLPTSEYPNDVSIVFGLNDAIFWVSRSAVEQEPEITSAELIVDTSNTTASDRYPIFSPIVACLGSISPPSAINPTYSIQTSTQNSYLPFLTYIAGRTPRQNDVGRHNDAGEYLRAWGVGNYQIPNSGLGWVGLSVGDVMYPKFQNSSGAYSVVPTTPETPNEDFSDSTGDVPNWFRPHYRKDGVGGEASCWGRYGESLTNVTDIVNENNSRLCALYNDKETSGDWEFRFLRYPPRARHVLGQSFYDIKSDPNNNSFSEIALAPPYRSVFSDFYKININGQDYFYGLSPVADVYTSAGTPWTTLMTDGRPLPRYNASGQINYDVAVSGFNAYGFRVLKRSDEKQVCINTRIICSDQPSLARVVFRNMHLTAFGSDIPVEIAANRSNINGTTKTTGTSYYKNYMKNVLVHEDKTSLGGYNDSHYATDTPYDPVRYYYKLSQSDVGVYDISGITDAHKVLTIPRLVVYNAGSDVPQETLFFYGILGERETPGTNIFVPVCPQENELVAFEIIDIGKIRTQKVVTASNNYLSTTLILENVALKVPKNISSDRPYVGLEIRVLTPGRAREQANGAPRQAVPVIARNHIIGADGLDEPVYTNLEIWANTYRPNGSTKPNWEFFFLTEPPKEKTTYDYQFSASVIVGDTWGKRSRWVGVSGTGNKIRFQINVPTTDFDKRVVQIVIARQTSQGPVVVHKERITSGGSKTIDVPTSNLQAPNFKALYSQTEPKYGPVLSDNQRIIVGGPTSAFLSHVGDGLSWKLRPDDELDGTVVPLPDSMMFVTKYSGKPFFVSGSDTYVLVNENAFNVTFLPSSSSVSPTTQYDTNNMPIWSNMLVGLMHIGEDGFYQGEQKLIAFTERLPHTIKGLYVDDLIFTPLLVVEKTDSIDIYWSDTSTPGFVRWSLERESEERTVNQILYMGGYLYIVTAKGFSQDRPNLQIMKVGSSTNTVPLNRVHYRTNPLRSPVGLRARKMRGIFVDPTDHTSNIDKVSVSFYRKPFHDPSYTSSLITTQTLKNHKTVSVRHRDMKLEALNIEIKWLDPGSVLHRLELITYPGVNW